MHKKYLEKRAQVVRNQAKDILERPDFKEAAAELGRKWLVEQEPIATIEESTAWNEKHRKDDQDYMRQWPDVRTEILKARSSGDLQRERQLTDDFNSKRPINALRLDIEKLMSDFHIQLKWFQGIRRYVFTQDETLITCSSTVTIHEEVDLKSGEIKELSLIITKDTRLEDVRAIWSEVQYFQQSLPGIAKRKNISPRNRDRDAKIAEQTKTATHSEIAEEFGLESYDQVSTIVRNRKRRTGKS